MSYSAPPNGFRTFVVLWLSQSVSAFGSTLSMFAVNIWLVQVIYPLPEQQAQLGWALASVGLSFAIPTVLTMPLAGALADRVDRKRLMFSMDVMNGLLVGGLAYLMGRGLLTVPILLAIIVAHAVAAAVHGSAFDTSYAMLVTDAQLPRANGMMQTMWSLSMLLSPALAATLVALPGWARAGAFGGGWIGLWLQGFDNGAALAMSVDGLTFFLAALVLICLTIPSPKRADLGEKGARTSIWADVRFGVEYIGKRKPLLWLLATFAVVNLCSPLGVLIPLIIKSDLAADWLTRGYTYETALALVNTAMALGGVVGGFIVSAWGGAKRRRVVVLMLAIVVGGLSQMGMGLAPTLFLAAGACFVFDFTGPVANAHSQAIWQSQVPREMQGRVFAVRRVIAGGLGPLSQVLAGWLVGIMAPGAAMAMLGGAVALVGLVQLFNPQVMRVEDKGYLDRLAETPSV